MPLINRCLPMLLAAVATSLFVSCAPSVDQPKGTSKGYTSARLIQRDPAAPAITNPEARQIHSMIQKSIAGQFTGHGLSYGSGGAGLIVGYMVIYQEPGMTATYPQYFGYGRNEEEISDLAHTRGALDNKRPDFFRQAGIVIDVIDSQTNKLVYRGFSKGDVVRGASAGTRAARINAAVAESLAPFFP
ncbi:MAG: DUF4136 domain-containing protein [Verrucomicrobiota bacterium]